MDAVEKLESGPGGEEDSGVADDRGVVGVNAGDHARKDQERDAHAGHERGAEDDGGVASVASGQGIAAADGLTYTDGGRGRNAERNHVSEGDGVERDLVAGQRNGAESGDERGDHGEDADFGGELQGGWQAEGNEAADALDIDFDGSLKEVGAMAMVVPEQVADENEGQVGARDCSGPAGAGYAEGGHTEFAEDENVVAAEIDEIGGDQGEGDGADHVHPLEGAAYREIEEQRKHADGEGAHVGKSQGSDFGVNTHAAKIEREIPNGEGEDRGECETEVDAIDEGAVAIFAMAGAEGLGDEGVEAD